MKKEWYIILILGILLFLQRSCQDSSPCPEVKLVSSDTVRPRPSFRIVKPKAPPPKIFWKDSIHHVKVPIDVDTLEILKQYFSKVHYLDTIRDSLFTAVISDTVSQNQILSRSFMYMDLKPTIINKYEVVDAKNKWFIGGQIGGNATQFDAGVSLLLINKKDHGYFYTYQAISKTHNAGMYWLIRRRK